MKVKDFCNKNKGKNIEVCDKKGHLLFNTNENMTEEYDFESVENYNILNSKTLRDGTLSICIDVISDYY